MNRINKPFLVLLTSASLAMTSCGNDSSPKEINEVSTEKEINETEEPKKPVKADEESDLLIENKVLHAFSNPAKKDEFRIVITGKSLLKGKALLTVTSSDGKSLVKEAFDANYLLGYDFTGNINSKKETDAFITKRIKEFFSEDRFSVPAIEEDVVFEDQSYYIDKETWEEVKANKQAIGFYYLLGAEDGRHIAFSKKKGKVVMFYNCC